MAPPFPVWPPIPRVKAAFQSPDGTWVLVRVSWRPNEGGVGDLSPQLLRWQVHPKGRPEQPLLVGGAPGLFLSRYDAKAAFYAKYPLLLPQPPADAPVTP